MTTNKLKSLIPLLRVRDLKRSMDFYTNRLGFEIAFFLYDTQTRAGVCRDGLEIHLEQPFEVDEESEVPPVDLRFEVDDPDALHHELSERGGLDQSNRVRVNGYWDFVEFTIADPDGHRLIFFRNLIDDELK